jgi:uncharacterized membrane protein
MRLLRTFPGGVKNCNERRISRFLSEIRSPVRIERTEMKTASVAGIMLIVLGVIALAYQGINYTTQKKVLDIGPIQATKEEHKTIPVPPIVGGIALIGGIALLVAGGRDS